MPFLRAISRGHGHTEGAFCSCKCRCGNSVDFVQVACELTMNHPVLPPDERFWNRYSKNHELPLSGFVSAGLHLGALALLLFGVLALFGRKDSAISFDVVTIDEPGGQQGHDAEPLKGVLPSGEVGGVVATRHEQPSVADASQRPDVVPPTPPTIVLPPEGSDLPVPKPATANRPLPRLAPLLRGSPDGIATKGSGTPGQGPGKVGGRILTEREKRQYRWTMLFRHSDVRDYVRQLQALGAILGVQHRDKRIELINDLSRRPVSLETATQDPDRIFWMDDHPPSVASLATELQLRKMPWRFIAYFPEALEQRLLERELAYGRSFGRNSEAAIHETKFEVTFRSGQARIEVVEQK